MAADQSLAAMKYVVSSENFYVSDSWIFLDSFMSGMDFLSTYNFFCGIMDYYFEGNLFALICTESSKGDIVDSTLNLV